MEHGVNNHMIETPNQTNYVIKSNHKKDYKFYFLNINVSYDNNDEFHYVRTFMIIH